MKKIHCIIFCIALFFSHHNHTAYMQQKYSYTKIPLLITLAAGLGGFYIGYKNSLLNVLSINNTFGSFTLKYIPESLTQLGQSKNIQILIGALAGIKAIGSLYLGLLSGSMYTHDHTASGCITLLCAAGIAIQAGGEFGVLEQAFEIFCTSRLSLLSTKFSLT